MLSLVLKSKPKCTVAPSSEYPLKCIREKNTWWHLWKFTVEFLLRLKGRVLNITTDPDTPWMERRWELQWGWPDTWSPGVPPNPLPTFTIETAWPMRMARSTLLWATYETLWTQKHYIYKKEIYHVKYILRLMVKNCKCVGNCFYFYSYSPATSS